MKKALFFLIGAPFFVWLFIFAAKYAIFGSDPYPPRTWQEEVRLSDGTVILTERYANWERPGRPARRPGPPPCPRARCLPPHARRNEWHSCRISC